MISNIFNGLTQLTIGIIQICIRLFTFQFIPAIFFVTVWLTEQGLMLFPRLATKLRPGLVVVLSTVAWSLIWLVIWLLSFGLLLSSDLIIFVPIAGGLWGLAVGGTLAREWAPPTIIAPPIDPMQASGMHSDMLVNEPLEESITIDELFGQGIFVGQNMDSTRNK